MNISITEAPPTKGKGKKHQWLYNRVDELEKGKTLEIEFESIIDLRRHDYAVRRMYRKELDTMQIEMRTRKYKTNGASIPTLYITRN